MVVISKIIDGLPFAALFTISTNNAELGFEELGNLTPFLNLPLIFEDFKCLIFLGAPCPSLSHCIFLFYINFSQKLHLQFDIMISDFKKSNKSREVSKLIITKKLKLNKEQTEH